MTRTELAYVLPSFAFATLTRTLAQFVLLWLCIVVTWIAEVTIVSTLRTRHATGLVTFDVSSGALILLVALLAAIAVWQYGWRQTTKARVVLACL